MICGTWYVDHARSGYTLILQREPVSPLASEPSGGDPIKYCRLRFDFHENGDFVDSYMAPCGNDGWIHHWTGSWKLGEDDRTLILQVENYPVRSGVDNLKPSESYKKGQEFHIIEITKEEMQLELQSKEHVRLKLYQYVRRESY